MLQLWPATGDVPRSARAGVVSEEQLVAAYAYPEPLDAPWVRVNFVASADGASSVEGRAEGLSSPADRRVFLLLRELCDVVLVGAGTARAEDYAGARRPNRVTGVVPPIAVLTASGRLDPGSRLFTDTAVAPLVVTGQECPPEERRRLREAGAEVVVLDGPRPEPAAVLQALGARGLHRVLCEGGPTVLGEFVAAEAVDELCLTISPQIAGGTASRIVTETLSRPGRLRLIGALVEDDTLLLRYVLER